MLRSSRNCLAAFALAIACPLVLAACADAPQAPGPQAAPLEWRTYAGSLARTFFNPNETVITRETAPRLVPLWRFTTGAIITASPIVSTIEPAGLPAVQALFIPSWDGNLYALRTSDGGLLWSHRFKPHPGASYPQAGSASVEEVDGRRVVFVASGMTMNAFDAASGEHLWEFDAGTGCTDCDSITERNQVESSPAYLDGVVYFGMDINDTGPAKGGFYAVDARRGTLRWYFDLVTGATCTPRPGDDLRRFDGYHTADELGLPEDFFATRDGCDFDRRGTTCGNVWSSAAIDPARRLLYTASSNCDTDDSPDTPETEPPMRPYDEALFALDVDTGTPAWHWRPREVDNDDLSFGAVPNLFAIELSGEEREVVGVGNKDGTYYVLDRDGTNELSGRIEPYWATKVVPGGAIGGIIATAAVGEGKVMFSTAIGLDIAMPQLPAAWGLDMTTGAVRWNNPDAQPSYSPTSAIPGVVFMGSLGGSVIGYDSDTGERLVSLAAGGPVASPAVVVDGRLFVGGGTGERGGNPERIAFQVSLIPTPVSAFCVAGSEGCPENGSCDDGNTCTVDERTDAASPTCSNQPRPDGTACSIGSFAGSCQTGVCIPDAAICPDVSQCSRPVSTGGGCTYESEEDGTACTVRGSAGECRRGTCVAF